MNDVAAKWPFSGWEMQLIGQDMIDDREKYIQALADKKYMRMQMRHRVRTLLDDKVLQEALRAQAWLATDEPNTTALDDDGNVKCLKEGWPLGCGEHAGEIKARLAQRLFADETARAENSWLFEDDDGE